MATDRKPRIAVAGFQHETNTFAPVGTGYRDFLDGGGWPGLTTRADVLDTFRGLNIPISGFIGTAAATAEIVPILWTSAEPANRVTADAFERICEIITDGLRAAGPLDGVYLDLHGAMVAEGFEDGEGELLRRIRDLCGPDVPIAVSLDLHANISPQLVAQADVITIYRTYPHLDMDTAGTRAWALLREIIRTGTRPAKAFRQASSLIPLSAQCTDFGPLRALYDRLESVAPAITADIALGFPLSDVRDCGPSLVTYATDTVSAQVVADDLIKDLERAMAALDNALLTPENAVAQALALTQSGGTVVLADVQDNSGAGAMSDTTGLLRALVAAGTKRVILGTLWDPAAASQAHAAGVGRRISIALGGHSGPKDVAPLACQAQVLALTDGVFTCTGEMQCDVVTEIGPTARLKIDTGGADVEVVVSALRHQTIDQAALRHIGADPANYRIVALKSTVHFRADFAPMAIEVLNVGTPGYSFCRPDLLTFHNLRDGVSTGSR